MSRKFTIGYYVANRPDDPVYRIRAVHDGEQPPREAVWSGTGWDAAVTAASEANYRRQQRERGKFVFHVLPYKYAEGIIYVPDRTHYRLDEVPPVLPNEITQSENYAIARRAASAANREYREKERIRLKEEARLALVRSFVRSFAPLLTKPWEPKTECTSAAAKADRTVT